MIQNRGSLDNTNSKDKSKYKLNVSKVICFVSGSVSAKKIKKNISKNLFQEIVW